MFHIGIDLAKLSHQVCIIQDQKKITSFAFKNSSEGFDLLLQNLSKFAVNSSNCIIAMESTSNFWENLFSFLESKNFNVRLLNPFFINSYRKALAKKTKNDKIDAFTIAAFLQANLNAPSFIPDQAIQDFKELSRLKANCLFQLKNLKRKASNLIYLVFPEFLQIVKDPFAKVALAILAHYPTAKHFLNLKSKHLVKIARKFQGNNFSDTLAKSILEAANNSIYSGKSAEARALTMRLLLQQISQLQDHIQQLEDSIKELLQPKQDSFSEIVGDLPSIPGIGPNTMANFIGEVGDVNRFSSGKKLIGYIGFYPREMQSGNTVKVHGISQAGPARLRHALYLAAVACVKHNPALKTFYHNKLAQGKSAKQALIVLARKIALLLYSMLKYKSDWNPQRLHLCGFSNTS